MGQFLVSDYAEIQYVSGPYLWRGYTVRFAVPIILTAIIGGVYGTASTTYPAYVALFHSNEGAIPLSLIGYGTMTQSGFEQVIEVEPMVTEPDQWYLIAQAGTTGSNSMASVWRWDVPAMVAAEEVFAEWHPVGYNGTRGEQFYGYNAYGHPNNVIGVDWSRTGAPNINARPYLGFRYEEYSLSPWYPKVEGKWLEGQPSPKIEQWKPSRGSWAKKGGVWRQVIS